MSDERGKNLVFDDYNLHIPIPSLAESELPSSADVERASAQNVDTTGLFAWPIAPFFASALIRLFHSGTTCAPFSLDDLLVLELGAGTTAAPSLACAFASPRPRAVLASDGLQQCTDHLQRLVESLQVPNISSHAPIGAAHLPWQSAAAVAGVAPFANVVVACDVTVFEQHHTALADCILACGGYGPTSPTHTSRSARGTTSDSATTSGNDDASITADWRTAVPCEALPRPAAVASWVAHVASLAPPVLPPPPRGAAPPLRIADALASCAACGGPLPWRDAIAIIAAPQRGGSLGRFAAILAKAAWSRAAHDALCAAPPNACGEDSTDVADALLRVLAPVWQRRDAGAGRSGERDGGASCTRRVLAAAQGRGWGDALDKSVGDAMRSRVSAGSADDTTVDRHLPLWVCVRVGRPCAACDEPASEPAEQN